MVPKNQKRSPKAPTWGPSGDKKGRSGDPGVPKGGRGGQDMKKDAVLVRKRSPKNSTAANSTGDGGGGGSGDTGVGGAGGVPGGGAGGGGPVNSNNQNGEFTSTVLKDGDIIASGIGETKKKSEQDASKNALIYFGLLN